MKWVEAHLAKLELAKKQSKKTKKKSRTEITSLKKSEKKMCATVMKAKSTRLKAERVFAQRKRKQAQASDDAEAKKCLARLYSKGDGVAKDYKKAAE
jgi:hypothetical protein